MSARALAAVATACALVLACGEARADFVWLPGAARTLVRTDSASRDTPAMELAYGPRAEASLGSEMGFASFGSSAFTVHVSGYGMVALENGVSDAVFPPFENWRGLVGFGASVSADALARRWFGKDGGIELTLLAGHESDHRTDAGPPLPPVDELPNRTGDFLAPDLAWQVALGRSLVKMRLLDRVYLRGTLADVPGADLDWRLRLHPVFQPRVALYGEGLLPHGGGIRLGFFGRAVVGCGLVGRFGEATPFLSFDAGNDLGVLSYRREARFGVGIRYAPF